MAERKIMDIENGTVIDHIPAGKSIKVLEAIGLKSNTYFLGINVDSKLLGHKDLIKMENRMLSPDEIKKIANIAPASTINVIKGYKVVEKKQAK